jgi:hypothetical protein
MKKTLDFLLLLAFIIEQSCHRLIVLNAHNWTQPMIARTPRILG